MARRVNHDALRVFVLKSDIDAILPFIDTANEMGIRPGNEPLEPLSAEESRRLPGSTNVRAFVDWIRDYPDEDERFLKAALASIEQRAPGMLLEPEEDESEPTERTSDKQSSKPIDEPLIPDSPPTISKKKTIKRKDMRKAVDVDS